MSKKGTQSAPLSPENYIRKKARTLPVYECLVNTNWETAKLADVVVARRHSNGNITAGFFLVDLMALGIKDGTYCFNYPIDEYNDLVKSIRGNMEFKTIDYTLAHNIILAAEEYAGDLGIEPCKLYRDTIKYILEEDTDDIELIEIECGVNGKPMLFLPEDVDATTKQKYHEKMKKAVGEDGYEYMEGIGSADDVVEKTEDEERFCHLFDNLKTLTQGEADELWTLLHKLNQEYCSDEILDAYYEQLGFFKSFKIHKQKVSPEFLGLKEGDEMPSKSAVGHFLDILKDLVEDKVNEESLNKLRKLMPGHPATLVCEALSIKNSDSEKFAEFVTEAHRNHPDYGMLQLINDFFVQHNVPSYDPEDEKNVDIKRYFGNRTEFNQLEIIYYCLGSAMLASSHDNLEYVVSIVAAVDNLKIDKELKYFVTRSLFLDLLIIMRSILD